MVVVCGLAEVVAVKVFGLRYGPYDFPLGRTYFPDFVRFSERFRWFHSAAFFAPGPPPFLYPTPAAAVYAVFYRLFPRHALPAFLGFAVGILSAAAVGFGITLSRRGIRAWEAMLFSIVVLACSYPVWTVLKQGNIEIAIAALVTAGVTLFVAGRGYSAAACFGLAASMKLYPVIFLGLFMARRQYREMAWGVCVLVGATVLSLWLVCPSVGVSWQAYREGVAQFGQLYVVRMRPEIGTDHSLFALLKQGLDPLRTPEQMSRLLGWYLVSAGVIGVVLFFVRIRRLPVVNQVICLSVASVLLPPVSYEYTLLAMFAPAAMLVLLAVDGRGMRGLAGVMCCLALLLGPMPELIWRGQVFEGQVKALVLVLLFWVGLRYPFVSAAAKSARFVSAG